MRKVIQLTLAVCVFGMLTISASVANPETKGRYFETSANINDSSIFFKIDNNYLRIDFINPSVFRIRMNNKDNFPEGGMVRYGIVNTRCQPQQIKKTSSGSKIEFSTDAQVKPGTSGYTFRFILISSSATISLKSGTINGYKKSELQNLPYSEVCKILGIKE